MLIRRMLRQGRAAGCLEESRPADHAHDVLCSFILEHVNKQVGAL